MTYYHQENQKEKSAKVKTKNKSIIIVLIVLTSTILNKYFIHDPQRQWLLAMVTLSGVIFTYSLFEWLQTKSKGALILALIFASETIAVICGWDLKTQYYTEFLLILLISALYYTFKKWRKQ